MNINFYHFITHVPYRFRIDLTYCHKLSCLWLWQHTSSIVTIIGIIDLVIWAMKWFRRCQITVPVHDFNLLTKVLTAYVFLVNMAKVKKLHLPITILTPMLMLLVILLTVMYVGMWFNHLRRLSLLSYVQVCKYLLLFVYCIEQKFEEFHWAFQIIFNVICKINMS